MHQGSSGNPTGRIGGELLNGFGSLSADDSINQRRHQMIGRRAVIGLSLLSALVFCAFAASSSPAAITAYTCVKKVEVGGAGFSKGHCKITDVVGSGAVYEEKTIAADTATEIEVTNEETNGETSAAVDSRLEGLAAGIKTDITCKKVTGTGNLTNNSNGGKTMTVTGSVQAEFSECETELTEAPKPKACKVKEPIVATANYSSVIEGAEMYAKLEQIAGIPFATLKFENNGAETCPAALKIAAGFPVTGSVTAEEDGATLKFPEKHSKLLFAGNAATFTSIATLRMKAGNPIFFTTK
jgi:hypothetical protein